MSVHGSENVYTCPECGGLTVTVDIDVGVTPFLLGCRASGREGDCGGLAESAFYPAGKRPSHIPEPVWEWYRPTDAEVEKMSPAMQEHIHAGGLDIRLRSS